MWTQGPVRRDCAPWEVTWKEIPLLIFVWYSKWWTHIFRQRLPQHWTSVTPPRLLAMGEFKKDQEDYTGVIDILPLLGGKPLVWMAKGWEFCCLPSLISYAPWSCIWWWKVLLLPSTGSISGCHHNVKMFCFNIHFVVLVSEWNSK